MAKPDLLRAACGTARISPATASASTAIVIRNLSTVADISTRVLTAVGNSTIIASSTAASDNAFESKIIIPLYVIIFMLSMVGNTMVLFTLFQNKRMRTVTNVYLVNLAISDLLLGVLCMPFTLIGQVLRNFIFGAIMCKLIPYAQAVSVSVAVWTLVAISLERYFAICSPLKSRRWQTQFHAYKMICFVWLASLLWSSPVLLVSTLTSIKSKGTHKCREVWPSKASDRIYSLFLEAILLIIPLVIMTLAYSLIISKLWKGLQKEIEHNNTFQQFAQPQTQVEMKCVTSSTALKQKEALTNGVVTTTITPTLSNGTANAYGGRNRLLQTNVKLIASNNNKKYTKSCVPTGNVQTDVSFGSWFRRGFKKVAFGKHRTCIPTYNKTKTTVARQSESLLYPPLPTTPGSAHSEASPMMQLIVTDSNSNEHNDHVDSNTTLSRIPIRSNYMDKSIEAKKKVIRMLFVIVLEFFICWAPLHILNTWYLYNPAAVYDLVGATGVSLVQLLAFVSSCCNPITYCFMNRKFRQSFLAMVCSPRCCRYCCKPNDLGLTPSKSVQINKGKLKIVHNSDGSVNESTIYAGRASTLGRSEVMVLEGEERV
ncbi:cholecystokinin receptor-like [Atheta coriaria]|uniref:cholecystokinin receptor-like n=1 Tax=Dalotia coriaria TaxID=877792 RepID=UPI0031F46145